MDELLQQYKNSHAGIGKYFGHTVANKYIVDHTDKHWTIVNHHVFSPKYLYSANILSKKSVADGDNIYDGKCVSVYRRDDYTLVLGENSYIIFKNTLECTDKEVKKCYLKNW